MGAHTPYGGVLRSLHVDILPIPACGETLGDLSDQSYNVLNACHLPSLLFKDVAQLEGGRFSATWRPV